MRDKKENKMINIINNITNDMNYDIYMDDII